MEQRKEAYDEGTNGQDQIYAVRQKETPCARQDYKPHFIAYPDPMGTGDPWDLRDPRYNAMPWILFVLSAAVIVVAGAKLSHYGDQIAELTGLGRLWIGMVLIAVATSLPELLTDISAALLHAPDLAVGDLFGSNMANMLILGLLGLLPRQTSIREQAAYEHILSATLAMVLTGLAGLFIMLKMRMALWGVGLDSALIALIYVLGMRVAYRQEDLRRRERERETIVEATDEESERVSARHQGLRHVGVRFALATLAIVVAAPVLAWSAKAIAEITTIGTTFVGTSLLAVTTSLPEVVTSLAAVRLGAFDLAVGNLFGSNAFNMFVLFFTDVAYRPGPLLSGVGGTHTVTAFFSILLMSIGLMGIVYRAEKRFFLIKPDSLLIIVGYGLGMWVVFRLGE
jgi:cation:H+ antiporter